MFWQRLRDLGWVEGTNFVVEARWANGRYERLPALMAEVVTRNIDVLVTYSTPGAIAAKKATSEIPIVVASMGDPVGIGLVTSLARPGSHFDWAVRGWDERIGSKWLELLKDTVPRLSTVAVIANPDNPAELEVVKQLQATAPTQLLKLDIIEARTAETLEPAFKEAQRRAQGVVVSAGTIAMVHRRQIAALAVRDKLPAMYGTRDFVDAGGLMAYGPDLALLWRQAAEYVDKILRCTKPADLSIGRPTQYALFVNLRAARALGLTMPEAILLRADHVIK
jgi:putative ABC transport system substrate-binding protein